MHNIVTKLKVMNTFSGGVYQQPINTVIDTNNLNSYENILNKDGLNDKMLYFLSIQHPEDREFLFDNISSNENFQDFLKVCDEYPILNKNNLKWFSTLLELGCYGYSIEKNIIGFVKSSDSFVFEDSFNYMCSIIKDLKGYSESYINTRLLKMFLLFQNDNLNYFNFDDVSKILDNTSNNIDLSSVSKEILSIYTDSISIFLPEATIENYNFCRLIDDLCGNKFLNDCKYWLDGVFKYSNKISSIVDLLDELEKPMYLKELISSYNVFFEYNYSEGFDNFLDKILMKISYGERYCNLNEILLAGLEVVDTDYSTLNMFNLAKVKSIGSKGLYKKCLLNKSLCSVVADYVGKFKAFFNVLDLGALNEEEVLSLINYFYYNLSKLNFSDKSFKISFKELQLVITNNLDASIFEHIKEFKIADRIKVINILLATNKQSNKIYSIQDVLNTIDVSDLLKKHTIFGCKDIQTYIDWRMVSSKVSFDISSKEELFKIKSFISLKPDFSLLNVSKDSIDSYILSLDYIKEGFKKFDIPEEFVLRNSTNSIRFILDGGFDIALSYYKNNYVKPLQRKNLGLIVKAILVGKYKELKFNYNDIFKEIELNISESSFNNWVKDDELSNATFTVRDTGDFNTIMSIGVNPVRSCMNYASGSYSYCLLSNIDTAKKILTIHKNDVYVGRAILRLTKSSSTGDNSKILSFIDVENNESYSLDTKEEKLVLFVEKMYTSLDSKDLSDVYSLMIDFLKQKATSIGAELMLSYYYDRLANTSDIEVVKKDTYIFITASKNGAQYLDSLDGSTTYSCSYKSTEVLLY